MVEEHIDVHIHTIFTIYNFFIKIYVYKYMDFLFNHYTCMLRFRVGYIMFQI